MNKLTTTGLVLLATAVPALAQTSVEEVAAQLAAEGYTDIEATIRSKTIKIEGYRDGQERELVFDASNWDLLEDETYASDDDDDDDDDDRDDRDDDDDDRDDRDDDDDEDDDDDDDEDDDDDDDEDDDDDDDEDDDD